MSHDRSILLRMTADQHAELVARYGHGKVSAGIRAALFGAPPTPQAPAEHVEAAPADLTAGLPGNQPPSPVEDAPTHRHRRGVVVDTAYEMGSKVLVYACAHEGCDERLR